MAEIRTIDGGLAVDDRGTVSFVNAFDFAGVKRFYKLTNFSTGVIRAFHGHLKEGKYVYVVKGAIILAAVKLDDVKNPDRSAPVQRFVLSAQKPRDRIHAQSIDVGPVEPVQRVRHEEVAHLVPAVIEDLGAPVRMLAKPRVGVLVQARAVEVRQAVLVTRKMRGHPVDDHAEASLVAAIDEGHEILWRAEARARSVVADDLVAPGAIERVLGDTHQLQVRVALVLRVRNQLARDLTPVEELRLAPVVATPAPRVHFVDIDRLLVMRRGLARGDPDRIAPLVERAQGYIALIREGRYEDALRVIKMDNPFPGICGRICNHRCETACNRGQVDEPINIRAIKRFVTDKVYGSPRTPLDPVEISFPEKRVAIIGAGPCGLTAAQDIIRAGYSVSIFEAMPVAGGRLRLGVPEYRLPTHIIEREIADIVDLGGDLRLNQQINNLDDLFDEGFEAVLIAVGAHEGIRLPIPGANLDGVLINTHFLRDVRLGKYDNGRKPDGLQPLGDNVLVLGGGNVAFDVARSAVRLGCKVSLASWKTGRRCLLIPGKFWLLKRKEYMFSLARHSRKYWEMRTGTSWALSAWM